MDLPFDGAISAYFEKSAPDDIRKAIKRAEKGDILNPDYPHSERLARKVYEKDLAKLQIELVKLQAWTKAKGQRIAMVFEGAMPPEKAVLSNAFAKILIHAGRGWWRCPNPRTPRPASGIFNATSAICPLAVKSCFLIAAGTIAAWWKRCFAFAPTRSAITFLVRSNRLNAL